MDCFEVMMEHVCDIYGPQTTSTDAGGGVVLAWNTVRTSGAKFLLNVSAASDTDRFAQTNLIGPIVGATFDTTLQRGDKLVVTVGPTLVGISLHVTGIQSQTGVDFLGFTTIRHITCEQIV